MSYDGLQMHVAVALPHYLYQIIISGIILCVVLTCIMEAVPRIHTD